MKSRLWKRLWCWKRLKAAGEGSDRGWDGLMASSAQWNESDLTPGDGEGQGSLVCCSPWGCKELDMNNHKGTVRDWTITSPHPGGGWNDDDVDHLGFNQLQLGSGSVAKLFPAKDGSMLTLAPILGWILLCSSPFMNIHVPLILNCFGKAPWSSSYLL